MESKLLMGHIREALPYILENSTYKKGEKTNPY